jgi:Fe-S-cluster-containing hydrogenase component 2
VCPVNAITQNNEGYPVVDYNLCIECGKCLKYCPMKAMKGIND